MRKALKKGSSRSLVQGRCGGHIAEFDFNASNHRIRLTVGLLVLATREGARFAMPMSEDQKSKEVQDSMEGALRTALGDDRYAWWSAQGMRLKWEEENLRVVTCSEFMAQRVRKRLLESVRQVAREVCGSAVGVQVVVEATPSESTVSLSEKRLSVSSVSRLSLPSPGRNDAARPVRDTGRVPRAAVSPAGDDHGGSAEELRAGVQAPSFADFAVGPCNQLAHVAAKLVVEHPGTQSPLFLWGPAGSGKSHLLSAIREEYRRTRRLRRVVLLSAEQFTNDFMAAVRGGGLPSFRRRYRDVEALLIDDIQFVGGKRATVRELLYTVDSLLRGRCQLALAADRPPMELEGLSDELAGRMAGGMVCSLRSLDCQTRRGILEGLAHRTGDPVAAGILDRLAEELAGDGRILSGAINHLRTLGQMLGRPAKWEELLQSAPDLIAAGRPAVHLGDIQKAVCDVFGLPSGSLQSRGQQRSVSQPRMLAMYLARQYTRAAYSEIGDYFGNRSHSTVIAATKRVEDWLEGGKPLQRGAQRLHPRQLLDAIDTVLRTG